MDPAAGLVASRLFTAVIEFWSLILQQESWALNSKPDTQSSVEDTDGDVGGSPRDTDMDSDFRNPDDTDGQQDDWKLERFLLNEECDRLCLWKFNFTDDDLDRLTGNESSVFGGAVVQCLVNIGQALINETGE